MPAWKAFLIVAPILLIIDLLWLGLIMRSFYDYQLGELARREGNSLSPRWGAALLVYLLIPGGLVLLARTAAGPNASIPQALMWGAIYGLAIYGTYDLTNRATLAKYPLALTAVDLAWGTFLCGISAAILRAIEKWLGH